MQIYLLLTEKCNLRCGMCIRGKQTGHDLSLASIKEAPWINELRTHDLVLSGGEPTLHPDFSEITWFFCKHANNVFITTNGINNSYLSKDFLRENLNFQVSIDGDEDAHDIIRGKGTFARSMSTVQKLDSLGARYTISSVVNRRNVQSIKKLELILRGLQNIKYWRITYEMPFGSANFKDMMTAKEWNAFVDDMISRARLKIKIQKIFPFELYDRRKEDLDRLIEKGGRCNNCGSGKDKIYIYPDLTVYPCTCLTDFPLGSLREKTIAEILNGKEASLFLHYEVNNEICRKCQYLKYCNGGCIGMSYHVFNKLGMGDARCPKFSPRN